MLIIDQYQISKDIRTIEQHQNSLETGRLMDFKMDRVEAHLKTN
ncbi:hypothetical protein pb186bvf_000796 [Paramecium bursaria]